MSGRSLDDLGWSLSWRDLQVLVQQWQKTPGTATYRSVHGIELWSVTDQLLANVIDILAVANWQRAGKSHAPKPKRYPRPWERAKARKLGSDPIPMSKFSAWWDDMGKRRRARRERE